MRKIVVKFGGSNLRTAGDIDKVASIAQSYGRPLVIVVSAFYGITNSLIECVRAAKAENFGGRGDVTRSAAQDGIQSGAQAADGGVRAAFPGDPASASSLSFTRGLRKLKRQIIDASIPDRAAREPVYAEVSARLDRLERYLLGIHYIGDVPDFLSDTILSYGERLSSLILAAALRSRGVDCEEILPEDLGLVTDGEFGNAGCDFAACEEPVAARLAPDRTFVVPGFYGIGPDGRATLFGRGGSDYSAAAIARCVGAESLDVWKDVGGFLSADPREVANPRRIAGLSYLEAAELSYFGAKILHPRTVEPLFDRNIPIRIMNVDAFAPGGAIEACTTIDGTRHVAEGIVKAVSSSEDVGILKLHGPGVGFKHGILAKVTGKLDDRGINIKSVITAQTAINILVGRADLEKAFHAVRDHMVSGVVDVTMNDDAAIVAVVGEGILDESGIGLGIAARSMKATSSAGIHVLVASAGASEVALYLLVALRDRARTVARIHEEFFGGKA